MVGGSQIGIGAQQRADDDGENEQSEWPAQMSDVTPVKTRCAFELRYLKRR